MKQTPGSELQLTKIKKKAIETLIHGLASLILILILSIQAYAEDEISFLTPEHGVRVNDKTAWLIASTPEDATGMVAIVKHKDTIKQTSGEAYEGDEGSLFHALLSLEIGLNEVTLGEESFSVFYRPRRRSADVVTDKKEFFHKYPPYSFHTTEKEEICSDCHEIDDTTCVDCHRELFAEKYIHGPLGTGLNGSGGGACVVCHDPESEPSRFIPRFGGRRELCVGCHEEKGIKQLNKKYFHGPVGSGDCAACHDPHGSPLRLQLLDEEERLCYICHDQKRIVNGKTVHGIIRSKGCGACHDSHASNYRAILLDSEKTLCSKAECHPRFAGKTEDHPVRNHPVSGKFGPDRKLSCSSCHNPHSSDFPSLLPGEKHSFCTQCHEGMVLLPKKES